MPGRSAIGIGMVALVLLPGVSYSQGTGGRTGQQVYESICVTCHGPGGRGETEMAKTIPMPDFSDCGFANREPDEDWLAVAHYGGPARGFSPLMPPWLGTLTAGELQLAVSHVRTFCTDERWPRGELNLPRPLVTEKAFPEDEAVFTFSAGTGALGSLRTTAIYERRFGPRDQLEVVVPYQGREGSEGDWHQGLGDVAVAYKRAVAHSLARGNIFSVAGEVVLPTGSEDKGLGGGVAVFEPFVAFGQILPRNAFLQVQSGVEIPASRDHEKELFARVALGASVAQARFGRTWSPMVEFTTVRALEDGSRFEWDIVPQMQVTLSTRQHIMLNVGVRTPLTDRQSRSATVLAYLLWDWYDGGFFSGW